MILKSATTATKASPLRAGHDEIILPTCLLSWPELGDSKLIAPERVILIWLEEARQTSSWEPFSLATSTAH